VPRSASAEFTISSRLDAPSDAVWERIITPEGINGELMPIFRMTMPQRIRGLSEEDVVIGERLCRSWILLFGVIPIDYDDVTVMRLDPGRSFLERSPMLSQRLWEHERTLEPRDGGCLVTDRIRWQPRLPLPPRLLRPLFRAVFRHRHRRLRRHFGGEPA
jgi:ligand-binding SRPBCC domain-containing protein